MDKDVNSEDLAKFIKVIMEESQLLRGQISSDLRQKVIHSLERDVDGISVALMGAFYGNGD